MLNKILSGDYPRSKILSVGLVIIFVMLAVCPFMIEILGVEKGLLAINTAAKIMIFILVAASYDMLLGYTAVISFAHTVFFAIGAWSVAIHMKEYANDTYMLIVAVIVGIVFSVIIAFIVGLLGLRVRSLFFTMITLALAAGFHHLIVHWSDLTGGLDGITFDIPNWLASKVMILPGENDDPSVVGFTYVLYYVIFILATAVFLAMLRLVNSPFGRVLQAIRENEFRCEAVGYKPVFYRIIAICISCGIASLAGSLYAIWLKSAVPNTFLDLAIMINILIMVVIGGMGSLYGAVFGAVIMVLIENYLKEIIINTVGKEGIVFNALLPDGTKEQHMVDMLGDNWFGITLDSVIDFLCRLTHPNRWNMYMGIFFVLVVYFFSMGIVGAFRILAFNSKLKKMEKSETAA